MDNYILVKKGTVLHHSSRKALDKAPSDELIKVRMSGPMYADNEHNYDVIINQDIKLSNFIRPSPLEPSGGRVISILPPDLGDMLSYLRNNNIAGYADIGRGNVLDFFIDSKYYTLKKHEGKYIDALWDRDTKDPQIIN